MNLSAVIRSGPGLKKPDELAGDPARHAAIFQGLLKGKTMTKKTEVTAAPIVRTSAGLRDAIFDEIDGIRNGSSNPTRANAVAKLAAGVVETVRMELEVQRHLRSHKAPEQEQITNALGVPLSLGA